MLMLVTSLNYLQMDEEDFGGEIELDDTGAFGAVLDEFLLEKKDNLFIEGTGLRKGVRASVKDPKKTEEEIEVSLRSVQTCGYFCDICIQ